MSLGAQVIKGVENDLSIEAYDSSSKVIFSNTASIDVSNILIENANVIRGTTITLEPSSTGNVSISNRHLKQTRGVQFTPATPSTETGVLSADSSGIYFPDGSNPGGTIKLARNLREAYGLTSQDANIAVTTYPVRLSDTAGTSNLLTINSQAGQNIMAVSNVAILTSRDISQTGRLSVTGDVNVTGNMTVSGNVTSINSEQLNIRDSFLYLNSGYTTTSGKSGGFAVNYLPTANSVTILSATFSPGVLGVSNPSISGLSALQAWAVDGKIIQVSGSLSNDGIYEILSSNASSITIRGVGLTSNSPNLLDVVSNQFSPQVSPNVNVREVNLAIARVNPANGAFQTAQGSTSAGLNYRNIGNVSFNGAPPLANTIPIFSDVSGGNIIASSVSINGANLSANALTLTAPAANSTVQTTNGVSGPIFIDGKYSGQSTNGNYTTIAILPINRANSTVMVSAFITGKHQASTNSLSARIDAGARSAGAGAGNVLTLSSVPIKSLFRSTGTPSNYNVDVTVSGTDILIRARGNTSETVDWQVDAKYSIGLFV